ncbi:MAG: hypothetical protein AB1772_11760 [Candidatus Zixiibacteriota bacterium]
MKGILATSLLMVGMAASTAFTQSAPPVPDSANFIARALSLRHFNPLVRDFNGGGARAKGMGNAFLGVSDDAFAVSWNPAGLYRQVDPYERPVMGLGYKSFSSDATFRDTYDNLPVREFDQSDVFDGVDLMSLLVPVRIKGHMFVGSIAYTRLTDEFYNSGMALDLSYPFDEEDSLNFISRPFHYRNEHAYRSWVNALNVGFGTRIYRQLAFGISVNAYGGRAAEETLENAAWEETDLTFLGYPGGQRGTFSGLNEVVDTSSYSGIYFTLGFKYTAEKLSAGLVIKTPHTLKVTRDLKTTSTAFVNGVAIREPTTIHNDDLVHEIDQPFVLGGGVGYKLREQWLVAADLEFRASSGGMINRRDSLQLVPGGTDIEYFTEIDPHWNNSMTFRAGTEYLWSTGSRFFPVVPIRAGIGFVQIPEPDIVGGDADIDSVTGEFKYVPETDQVSTVRWSLGSGLHWAQIHLDVSYERYSLDRRDEVIVRESSVDNSAFNLTFTGYF